MEALLPAAMSRAGIIDALNRSRQTELDELHRSYRPDRYRTLLGAWASAWFHPIPRVHVAPPPGVEAGEVGITFVGHAMVMLRFPHLSVVVDPMLGRHLGVVRRAAMPDLSPHEVGCDLILITGAAADHLHAPTLAKLPRTATVVVPPRSAALVSRLGFARVLELGAGASVSQRGVEVATTPVKFGAAPA